MSEEAGQACQGYDANKNNQLSQTFFRSPGKGPFSLACHCGRIGRVRLAASLARGRSDAIRPRFCPRNSSIRGQQNKPPFSLARQFGQMMRQVVNLACSCFGEACLHRIDLIREDDSDASRRVVEMMIAAIQPPISVRTGGRVLSHLGRTVQRFGPTHRRSPGGVKRSTSDRLSQQVVARDTHRKRTHFRHSRRSRDLMAPSLFSLPCLKRTANHGLSPDIGVDSQRRVAIGGEPPVPSIRTASRCTAGGR